MGGRFSGGGRCPHGIACALGLAFIIVLAGCAGTDDEATGDADTTVASTAVESVATETTARPTTTEPPPPDYDVIYRQLHDEAVAFIMNPLDESSDAMNCARNVECIVVTNQALEGQFWQGIGPDNLTVTSVDVLEEVSPDLVYLQVAAEAEELIELVDASGAVVESIAIPSGAVSRVALIKVDDDWVISSPMDGRAWTRQTYEAFESFSLVDPMDEPMTPTGEEGVTEDGVSWRALTTEDRFCIEAEKLPIGKVIRCLSEPQFPDISASIKFTMAFSGASAGQEYVGIWFGLKVDEGELVFEDDRRQIDEFFPVDTSAVFDGAEVSVAVSAIDGRPLSVLGRGPEDTTDAITFDWPVALAEP